MRVLNGQKGPNFQNVDHFESLAKKNSLPVFRASSVTIIAMKNLKKSIRKLLKHSFDKVRSDFDLVNGLDYTGHQLWK